MSDVACTQGFGVLNPQYPSSWWGIGFSDEVAVGEIVPNRVLERDIVLWRDSTGRLHCQSAMCPHLGANIGCGGDVVDDSIRCPFHGVCFDSSGAASYVPGESRRIPGNLRLTTYRVEEHYGGIFLWNGADPPDHAFPDIVGALVEDTPGLRRDEVRVAHGGFYLPYPAKWFLENGPDGAHFATVHRAAEWAHVEVLEETSTMMHWRLEAHNVAPYMSWGQLAEQARRGEMSYLVPGVGQVQMTTYGGGLHILRFPVGRLRSESDGFSRIFRYIDGVRMISCWTPVSAHAHIFRVIFLLPPIRVPAIGRLLDALVARIVVRQDFGGIRQDAAIMLHRREPADPVYLRDDRTLLKFRRFWDDRILDRSLAEGDNIHSNGSRAGVRWTTDREGTLAQSGQAQHG